jgi:hypothetical protein
LAEKSNCGAAQPYNVDDRKGSWQNYQTKIVAYQNCETRGDTKMW